MAPDSDVQIFRSKKGFEKLAYEGFLYNLDKRHQKYVLWRCEMSKKPGYKCSGRVRMTEDSLDVKFKVHRKCSAAIVPTISSTCTQ